MAMSCTITASTHTSVKKVSFVWVSAANGTASGTTTTAFDGQIIGMATIPAGGGSAPTDEYDVTGTDAGSHDVLLGAGANRDTANTEYVAGTSLAGVAGSAMTINVTNAGDTKGGTLILWIR